MLNIQPLFKAADIALYRVKEQGKSGFEFFTQALNMKYKRRVSIEHELMAVIRSEKLALLYQSCVRLADRSLVALEVSVNWKGKSMNLDSPIGFISTSGEAGVSATLGDYIIKSSLGQLQRWQEQYPASKFNLSIPLFPLQLATTKLVVKFEKVLKSFAIDLTRIEFKISHLLVKNIERSTAGAAVVAAIIALGKSLKVEVIAEGVENKIQAEFLLKHGCTQGWEKYYSEPLTASEAEKFFAKS